MPRHTVVALLAAIAALASVTALGPLGGTWALFTAATANGGNAYSTLTVQAAGTPTATSQAAGAVSLAWTASPTAAVHPVSYQVQRAPAATGPWTPAVSGLAVLSYTDTPPADGAYFYRIATVAGGFSTASGSTSAVSDRTPPAISWAVCDQDGLAAPATADWLHSAGTYVVYANASDALSGVASVTASVGLVAAAPFATPTLSAGSGTCGGTVYGYRSAVLTAPTLAAGARPVYADVIATDTLGNTAHTNAAHAGDVGVDNTNPGTPTVSATPGAAGSGKITWTWTAPTTGASGLAGYQVQVCNLFSGVCLPTVVVGAAATSYQVTVTSGQWYYALVTASSNAGLNGGAGFAWTAAP